MASEQPREASIFNAARSVGPTEARARYLDEACGDDAGLRERVEKLLATFDAESQFLEQPAPGLDATIGHEQGTSQEAQISDEILAGKYKLIEPIGEGGMGAVWRAQQFAPVKREVAVKLIKPETKGQSFFLGLA